MADKSNFTPDEWKLVLESVMMAGIAVTAADPSGLWGLLKESFASGTALMTAGMAPGSNPLIKAIVADFQTGEGRSTARDGVKEKLTGSKPAEIKAKCIETLRQAGAVVDAKAPAMRRPSRAGSDKSASTSRRQPRRVEDFSVLAACRSAKRKRRR